MRNTKIIMVAHIVFLINFFHILFTLDYVSKSHSLVCQCGFTVTFTSFYVIHVMVIGVHNRCDLYKLSQRKLWEENQQTLAQQA